MLIQKRVNPSLRPSKNCVFTTWYYYWIHHSCLQPVWEQYEHSLPQKRPHLSANLSGKAAMSHPIQIKCWMTKTELPTFPQVVSQVESGLKKDIMKREHCCRTTINNWTVESHKKMTGISQNSSFGLISHDTPAHTHFLWVKHKMRLTAYVQQSHNVKKTLITPSLSSHYMITFYTWEKTENRRLFPL